MSDRIETEHNQPPAHYPEDRQIQDRPPAQPPYATVPADPFTHRYQRLPLPQKEFNAKPFLIGAIIAAVLLFLIYQQVRINELSNEIGNISNDVRRTDVRSRVDALETQMEEFNTRIRYLDTKITAVDQKAQSSLDKWSTQENQGNFFTDLWQEVTTRLGWS